MELDEGEIGAVRYQRKDVETLLAGIDLGAVGLRVVYVWCGEGGIEAGEVEEVDGKGGVWKVGEVGFIGKKGSGGGDDKVEWVGSIAEADERYAREKEGAEGVMDGKAVVHKETNGGGGAGAGEDDSDEDDAYWAAYDQTPGPTPTRTSPPPLPPLGRLGFGTENDDGNGNGIGTRKRSNTAIYTDPTTKLTSNVHQSTQSNANTQSAFRKSLADSRNISASELAYFARYESEVQPAMDGHDPGPASGHGTGAVRSSDGGNLMGNTMTMSRGRELVDGAAYGNSNTANGTNSTITRNTQPLDATNQAKYTDFDAANDDKNNVYSNGSNDQTKSNNTVFNRYYKDKRFNDTNKNINATTTNEIINEPLPTSAIASASYPSPSPFSPTATTTTSSLSKSNLPQTLESYAALASHQSRVETAVRQHVGTQVKSMYRLAGSVGMGREEFGRLVRTEVELLGVGEEE